MAAGGLWLAACSPPSPTGEAAPAATASATAAPAVSSPDTVVRDFVTGALAGHAVAGGWDGNDGDRRAAVAAIRRAHGAVTVGAAVDGDAGMGQRHVTVPFAIGGVAGSAVLHKVAEGIESDDPHAHDWRIRTLNFPASPGNTP